MNKEKIIWHVYLNGKKLKIKTAEISCDVNISNNGSKHIFILKIEEDKK